jgi:hypothetical protein
MQKYYYNAGWIRTSNLKAWERASSNYTKETCYVWTDTHNLFYPGIKFQFKYSTSEFFRAVADFIVGQRE